MGAGGIGFDVSEYITHQGGNPSLDTELFWKEMGIDLKPSKPRRYRRHHAQPPSRPARWFPAAALRPARSATAWAKTPAGFTVRPEKTSRCTCSTRCSCLEIVNGVCHIPDWQGSRRFLPVANIV